MTDIEEYWNALDNGKVLKFTTKFQGDLYLRKVADVGQSAYEVQHPHSTLKVYDALEGKLYAAGVIESEKASVAEVLTLEEANERGVFESE